MRLYTNCQEAYNFIEQYMKECTGKKWTARLIVPNNIYKQFILKQRWLRELKNGDTECLKVKYMKIYG